MDTPMNLHNFLKARASAVLAVGTVCAISLAACGGGSAASNDVTGSGSQMLQQTPAGFSDTALVASNAALVVKGTVVDANLSNPWGLATAPGLPFWVADNNSNVATLYSGTGAIQTAEVTGSNDIGIVLPASAAGVQANSTGQVYNGTGGFLIPTSAGNEPALFIFDGEGGTISARAKDSGATAVTAYDDGVANGTGHAVYDGVALGPENNATFLYAPDPQKGKVAGWCPSFAKPADMQGSLIDPAMPSGFVPHGVAALKNRLYVSCG